MKHALACMLLIGWPFLASTQDKLPPPPVDEVGVYFQQDGKWTELPPEVVNWKTGGVVKNVSTLGVVKGDVNGKVRGSGSKTHLKQSIEILVL